MLRTSDWCGVGVGAPPVINSPLTDFLCSVPKTLGSATLNRKWNDFTRRHNHGPIEREVVIAMWTLLSSHVID